ncbi:hypothetical protein ACHAW6_010432 [Cyclotella cf. meneghiniana]
MSHRHSMLRGGKQKALPEDLHSDKRRASGKRYRRQYNPNSWSSSILTIRANILCLGMSYPSVDKALQERQLGSKECIQHTEPSVEQAIELVRRRILSTIDGRDYARIKAIEANNDMLAYAVSKEQGGPYEPKRHLNADFNSRTFLEQIKKQWGAGYGSKPIMFKQVILDYFWIPSGTWASNHWKQSFFKCNLPELVYQNLLNYGDLETDTRYVSVSKDVTGGDYVTSDAGVVYLPFCENCFVEVVACSDTLSKVFGISFLPKNELDEHTLWKATNTISAGSMQDWLEKKLDQEEEYCKLTRKNLVHGSAIGSTNIMKEEVLNVFDRINNVEEIRMIKLTALRMYHPDYKKDVKWPTGLLGVEKGGYMGLLEYPRPAIAKAFTTSAPTWPLQAPQPRAQEEEFLKKLALMLSGGNRQAVDISDSGPIVIKSRKQLNRILPRYFNFGDWVTFQQQLRLSGFKRRRGKLSFPNGQKQVLYFNKANCAKLQSIILDRNATLPTKHSLPGHSSQLANLLNDDTIECIQYSEPGCIEIRDKMQLLLCLPQYFRADITWEHFLSELHSSGYKMILSSEGSRFKYVNASLNHRGFINHKVKELGKRGVINPTPQMEAAADEEASKSVESIVNGQEIVLHLKNATYRRIMFDQFQIMTEKKTKRDELAETVLKQLKEAALDINNIQMEDVEGEESTSHYLFGFDRYQRKLYPVSDEEALKKILNDINRRNETASQWMQPRTRRTSRRHSSIVSENSPIFPNAPQNEVGNNILGRKSNSSILPSTGQPSRLRQSPAISPANVSISTRASKQGNPNASNTIPSQTGQDLDGPHKQSSMLGQSSVIPLAAAWNASNVVDPDQEFNSSLSMNKPSKRHRSHAMPTVEVRTQECDHRRFKITRQSFMAQETDAMILRGGKECVSNTSNHNLSSSFRVAYSFDETIFEHFSAHIGLQLIEDDSSVASVTDATAPIETPFLKVGAKF